MENVESLRKAIVLANRDSAIHKPDAALQSAQSKARDYGSDLAALPIDPTGWKPIQNLDPTSKDYGLFFPMTGY